MSSTRSDALPGAPGPSEAPPKEHAQSRREAPSRSGPAAPATRTDVLTLWGGILFSVLYAGLIWALSGRLSTVPHLPDQGASWYYWKLPSATVLGRASAWGLYLLHQFALWGIIFYAQKHARRYTTGLKRINVIALGANALFVMLHLLQTHLWYDGLAQDVSIWSSQASVVVMLVWVLLMENSRRGMFFGAKLPIGQQIGRFARKYHGYFFSWAIIYTFWYHPAEATLGHLWGFFYTLLLLLQSSLRLTQAHTNRIWTVTLEVIVLAHGTLVAITQGNGIWPMFFFGFGGIFVITQMHGLGWSRGLRALVLAAYVGAVLWVYNGRGFGRLDEILRIPLIDYLAVIVLALLIGAGLWIARRLNAARAAT